jgi:hypothetical protein
LSAAGDGTSALEEWLEGLEDAFARLMGPASVMGLRYQVENMLDRPVPASVADRDVELWLAASRRVAWLEALLEDLHSNPPSGGNE